MTPSFVGVLSLLVLIGLVSPVLAQTSQLFQWQFANTAISTSLPTCTSLPIVVKPFSVVNSTHGTPPYYMIAFAVGAAPITTLIGTDEKNLSWTVTHPAGSRLALSVVDSKGSAGGIPPQTMTVIAGSTTRCVIAPSTAPSFTVSANVTKGLTTCQPWGLTVKGGAPPYTVTLLALDSPIVTNVTMPLGRDLFTYINRADPSSQLIAGISDKTGQWASGTPIVSTQGSTNVTCAGLESSSSNSTQIQQEQDAEATASDSSKRHQASIVGVIVAFVLLIFLGLSAAAFFYIRKRKRAARARRAETLPTQYTEPQPLATFTTSYADFPTHASVEKATLARLATQNSYAAPVFGPAYSSPVVLSYEQPPLDRGASLRSSVTQRPSSFASQSAIANFPRTPARQSGPSRPSGQSAKALEASREASQSDTLEQYTSGSGTSGPPPPYVGPGPSISSDLKL